MKLIQTRSELAKLYSMDARIISKWLSEIGINHHGALKPIEIELFYKKVGDPKLIQQYAEIFRDKWKQNQQVFAR